METSIYWLVVEQPLKIMNVSWDDSSHYREKMFQTTNQFYVGKSMS